MKKILHFMPLIILLLLTGCKEQPIDYILETVTPTEALTESTTAPSSVMESQPKEYRHYTTYPVDRPTDQSNGNIYYYTDMRAVCYYDPDLRRTVYMCSQPNCTHNDEKCYAYLGGNGGSYYIVVGDEVYALVDRKHTDGTIKLIERNLITGEAQTLLDLTPEQNQIREQFSLSVCGEEIFLTFRQYDEQYYYEGSTSYCTESNPVQYSYVIDIPTGEKSLLLESKIPSVKGFVLSGSAIIPQLCTKDYLFIAEITYGEELPMSAEEYLEAYPNGDYTEYVSQVFRGFTTENHYSVNRKTGEKKWVFGDSYTAKVDGLSSVRDRKIAFVNDQNTVCVYDGYTGEVSTYFTQERIAAFFYYDGRIIYNVYPEDPETQIYTYYWYDLTTGESQQFQKGISLMVFSIYGETANYFRGLHNGRRAFISKQDFYNENYEASF